MRIFLMMTLFTFAACGDKDSSDGGADTSATTDTDETVDTSTPDGCAQPTVEQVMSAGWIRSTYLGGYVAFSTSGGHSVADVVAGSLYRLPFESGASSIRLDNDLETTFDSTYSFDKASTNDSWVFMADASYDAVMADVGRLLAIRVEDYDAATGVVSATSLAKFSVVGDVLQGYVGAGLEYDVTGDGKPDVVISSGNDSETIGKVGVMEDINSLSGEYQWSQVGFEFNACGYDMERDLFNPTDFTIFGIGDGDGYLAVNCPAENHGDGEVWIFALPLSPYDEPEWYIEDVGAWYMTSRGYGYPLYIDDRGNDNIALIREDENGDLTVKPIFSPDSSSIYFGSGPTIFTRDTCEYLVAGDQGYTDKNGEVGAVYVTALGDDGLPDDRGWTTLPFSSGEGATLLYMGAVNSTYTLDDSTVYVSSAGWGFDDAGGFGGGASTWKFTF